MTYQSSGETTYRVEVSGWDPSGEFFVEKTTLEWSPDGGKEVSMRAPIQEGDVVFVRLKLSSMASRTFPIACRAENISPRDSSGFIHVSLVQLRPRNLNEADQPGSTANAGRDTAQHGEAFAPTEACEKA